MQRPRFASVREYGAGLSDVSYWRPYIAAVLKRHGLAVGEVECGAVGTYPTFLVGTHVVKLFGPRFSGGEGYAVERSLHTLFLERPEVPAPALIACGTLFDGLLDDGVAWSADTPDAGGEVEDVWAWPYLITARLEGVAWRSAGLDAGAQETIARELGGAVRRVHALPVPEGAYWARDWVEERRAGCAARHRRWGSLPPALVEQMDDYLTRHPAGAVTKRLVHGDLHEEHIFVSTPSVSPTDQPHVIGIIDWGDAIAADPYYELPALHCGTFSGDKRLLRAFLDGYGWESASSDDFMHRAMTMTLLFEFDALNRVRPLITQHAPATLDALAHLLWAPE